jgi:alpha-galactosidase
MRIWMQIIRNCASVPSSELIEPAERLKLRYGQSGIAPAGAYGKHRCGLLNGLYGACSGKIRRLVLGG